MLSKKECINLCHHHHHLIILIFKQRNQYIGLIASYAMLSGVYAPLSNKTKATSATYQHRIIQLNINIVSTQPDTLDSSGFALYITLSLI